MIAKCLVVMAVLMDTTMVFSKLVDPLYVDSTSSETNNTRNNIENHQSLSSTSQINQSINATDARVQNNAEEKTTILNYNNDIIHNTENGTPVKVGNITVTDKKQIAYLTETNNTQEKVRNTKTDINSSDTLVTYTTAENKTIENIPANLSTEIKTDIKSSDTLVTNTIAENKTIENVPANLSTDIKSSDTLVTNTIAETKTLENISDNVSTEIKQIVAKPINVAISTDSRYNNSNITTELIKDIKPILQESKIKLSTTTRAVLDRLQNKKTNLTTEVINPIKAQIDKKIVTFHRADQIKEVEPTKRNQYASYPSIYSLKSAEGNKISKDQTVTLSQGGKKWKREMKQNKTDKISPDEKNSTDMLMPNSSSKNVDYVTNNEKDLTDMNNKNINLNKIPNKNTSTFFTKDCKTKIELFIGIFGIIGAGLFLFLTL